MKIDDYVARHDILASEDVLFDIPFRKEYVLAAIGKGRKVLDVGCLGGRLSRLILEANNEVWGVELNEAAAREAERRGVRVKVANVEEGLPFEAATFDAVHAGEIIEHLYDTKFFLEEANRVLRPGGVLVFTTPNLNSLDNRLRVLAGGYLGLAGAYPEDHFGGHIRVFNLGKIHELCRQTGFRVEGVRGVPALEPKGKWVDRALGVAGRLAPTLSKLLVVKARKGPAS
jgi:2-polyprenyl-3-methyl-5-hydroxy-6-metoxy-1,4-benzoquinol methylase